MKTEEEIRNWSGLKYWLLGTRWDYWVIWTPVKGNRRLARKLHDRNIPQKKRASLSFYSFSAARRSAKAQRDRYGCRKLGRYPLRNLKFRLREARRLKGWPEPGRFKPSLYRD